MMLFLVKAPSAIAECCENGCLCQPLSSDKGYDSLADGRKICHDCSLSVILDTEEV